MVINKNKGFTIIELIIVISIIAVLAAIVISNVLNYEKKSKIVAAQGEVNQIAKALILYQAQTGCLPNFSSCSDSGCDCCAQYDGECNASVSFASSKIINALINAKLLDYKSSVFTDPWNKPYSFIIEHNIASDGNLCSFVFSWGPDGSNDDEVVDSPDCNNYFKSPPQGDNIWVQVQNRRME